MKPFNKLYIGIIIGLILPFIVFFILLLNYAHQMGASVKEVINFIFTTKGFFKNLMSFSQFNLLPPLSNLAIFYLFLRKEYYKSIRGIILSTFLIAVFVFVVAFLF